MSVARKTVARMVDQKAFRDAAGRFASVVTVITTSVDRQPFWTTASAMSSLSMDPPMLLVCLNKPCETGGAVGLCRDAIAHLDWWKLFDITTRISPWPWSGGRSTR